MSARTPVLWPAAVQLAAGEHRLCTCGHSARWPDCDNHASRCDSAAHVLTLPRSRFVWLCQCHQTSTPPFCDGEGHIRAAGPGLRTR